VLPEGAWQVAMPLLPRWSGRPARCLQQALDGAGVRLLSSESISAAVPDTMGAAKLVPMA
jgi:hypothetical protein